jgi:hypothetical protein
MVRKAASDARAWMAAQTGDPIDMLRRMKFDAVGYHPIEGRALNLVEQINQEGGKDSGLCLILHKPESLPLPYLRKSLGRSSALPDQQSPELNRCRSSPE